VKPRPHWTVELHVNMISLSVRKLFTRDEIPLYLLLDDKQRHSSKFCLQFIGNFSDGKIRLIKRSDPLSFTISRHIEKHDK
jgi:hypothetical protein